MKKGGRRSGGLVRQVAGVLSPIINEALPAIGKTFLGEPGAILGKIASAGIDAIGELFIGSVEENGINVKYAGIRCQRVHMKKRIRLTDSEGDILLQQDIQPNAFDGSRMADQEKLFQRYRFTKVRIRYTPIASQADAGQLIGYFSTDPDDSPPSGSAGVAYAEAHGGVKFQVSSSAFFDMPINTKMDLYTGPQDPNNDGTDANKMKVQGRFTVLAVSSNLPTSLGTLSVYYEINYSYPQLSNGGFPDSNSYALLTLNQTTYTPITILLFRSFPDNAWTAYKQTLSVPVVPDLALLGYFGFKMSVGSYSVSISFNLANNGAVLSFAEAALQQFSFTNPNMGVLVLNDVQTVNSTSKCSGLWNFAVTGGTDVVDQDYSVWKPLLINTPTNTATFVYATVTFIKYAAAPSQNLVGRKMANTFNDTIDNRISSVMTKMKVKDTIEHELISQVAASKNSVSYLEMNARRRNKIMHALNGNTKKKNKQLNSVAKKLVLDAKNNLINIKKKLPKTVPVQNKKQLIVNKKVKNKDVNKNTGNVAKYMQLDGALIDEKQKFKYYGKLQLTAINYDSEIDSPGSVLYYVKVNPSMQEGSQLAVVSKLYQRYWFTKMCVTYTPALNTLEQGQIMMFFNSNIGENLDNGERIIATGDTKGGIRSAISQPASLCMAIDPNKRELYTAPPKNTTDADKLLNQSEFYFVVVEAVERGVESLGSLYLEYEVEFSIKSTIFTEPSEISLHSHISPLTTVNQCLGLFGNIGGEVPWIDINNQSRSVSEAGDGLFGVPLTISASYQLDIVLETDAAPILSSGLANFYYKGCEIVVMDEISINEGAVYFYRLYFSLDIVGDAADGVYAYLTMPFGSAVSGDLLFGTMDIILFDFAQNTKLTKTMSKVVDQFSSELESNIIEYRSLGSDKCREWFVSNSLDYILKSLDEEMVVEISDYKGKRPNSLKLK